MYKQGVILELRKKEAIVFNDHGEYDKIERMDGMYVGQVVEYKKTINKNTKRLISAISAAAVFIVMFFSYGLFKYSSQQVFAYVTLDINTSMEFSIDNENCVISLKPLNNDAENITKALNVKGKNIDMAIKEVITQIERTGFMERKSDNIIVISTSASGLWDKKDKRNIKIDRTRTLVEETVKNCTRGYAVVESIAATPEIRELSIEADMSLGRYVLYTKAISGGYDISLQEAKTVPLSQLIGYGKFEEDNYDKVDNTQNEPEDLMEKSTTVLNNDIDKNNITPLPKSESPTTKPKIEDVENNGILINRHEDSRIPFSDALINESENDKLLPKSSSSELRHDEIQKSTPVPELHIYDDKILKSTPVVTKPKYDGEVPTPTPEVTSPWEDKIPKSTHELREPIENGELPPAKPSANIPEIDDTEENKPRDIGPPFDEKVPKPTSGIKPPEHAKGRGPNFPDINKPEGEEAIPKPISDLPIPESIEKPKSSPPKPEEDYDKPEANLEDQEHEPIQKRVRVRNGLRWSF